MPINLQSPGEWTRKHDKPGTSMHVSKLIYPESSSLEDLIKICKTHNSSESFKATGSHWALSDAAVSDDVFIETNDPNNSFPAMGRTL